MPAKPRQLFEYLLAIKNMTLPPVRDIRDYEWAQFEEQLPVVQGCFLYGSGQDADAWVEIHKQTIGSPPRPHPSFLDWLSSRYDDPMVMPQVSASKFKIGVDPETASDGDIDLFADDQERVRQYDTWLRSWNTWAEGTRQKQAVQSLYQYFFALLQRLEREGETLELAFGHGMLTWKHPEVGTICRPLFVTRLDLTFDSKRGMFTLHPTQRGSIMETEMLSGVQLPNSARLNRLSEVVSEEDFDPHNSSAMEPIYAEIAQTLHPEGQYVKNRTDFQFSDHPIIIDKPALFLRKRAGQLWKEELQGAIDAIDIGYEVPKTIQTLFQMEPIEPSDGDKQAWASVGEQLLFPLPSNEDQRDIARRLATNFGAVVQGPPGTGKSHTIANLISHLLAHGKRVLVTSHTERALRVLADKVPEDIRALCVPVLGGDLKSLQEIEDSVDALSDGLASYDSQRLEREIEQIESNLHATRTKMAQLHTALREGASLEHQTVTVDGMELTPLLAAKWLAENNRYNWFPDFVGLEQTFPLADSDLRMLWQLKEKLTQSDLKGLSVPLPNLDEVMSPTAFASWLDEGKAIADAVIREQPNLDRFTFEFNAREIQSIRDELSAVVQGNEVLETPYLKAILEDVIAGGERERTWVELIEYAASQLSEIGGLRRELSEFEIKIPERPLLELTEDVKALAEKLREGKAGKLYFITGGRKIKYLAEEPIIDGHSLKTVADTEILLKRIRLVQTEERLIRKWNATVDTVVGPTVRASETRWSAAIETHTANIRRSISLAAQLQRLRGHFSQSSLPLAFSWTDAEWLTKLSKAVTAYEWVIKQREWNAQSQETLEFLRGEHNPEAPISHWAPFLTALERRDRIAWNAAYEHVKHLWNTSSDAAALQTLLETLRTIAPRWAQTLESSLGQHEPFPENWQQAFTWSRLNSWITKIEKLCPETIEQQLAELADEERRLIGELVAKSTWLNQLARITEPQKRALQAWKQKVKRIGKGTGKYANKYRKEARQEMEQCRGAIPVWIMPIHRVIENFTLNSDDQFDVVIVDESSQCDIHALSVLSRGKKAVIVGDDEQISPAAVGVDQSAVHGLIEQYLVGMPQANSLDVQTSLYDVAVRVFPGKLMLKEHFRCVPEIIQFSNDLSYNGDIIPLRLPTESERIDPPVLTRFVSGYRLDGNRAINEEESEAIVADIKEMIQDPRFADQTIGVISLQQEDQARLIEERLRQEIGEEEIYNRRIICGDAYAFQGDERDVIFISMVVANNVRFAALTKRDAQQRFNVAASRARNQMRVYHSVALSDLNPNDMRYRLLQYCQNPTRVLEEFDDLEKKCESQFEKDVLRRLLARGYSVRPQVQVGRCRIDFVIEGMKARLAVECDGDQWHGIDRWEDDMIRQRVLERAGWKFWRVRGSTFYRNPAKAMEPLWRLLDEMGIEPSLSELAIPTAMCTRT